MFEKGVLELDFNPAFLSIDEFDHAGRAKDALVVTSFVNIDPPARPDLAAVIPNIGSVNSSFNQATDLQFLTPSTGASPIIWPNEAERVPDGVLPFEGVVIPQGFHPAAAPGRLTIVDADTLTEYVVDQSTQVPGPWDPANPLDKPRFYHRALFIDMDNDGLKDFLTVRSGFRVGPFPPYPPISELVYFKNPGAALDPFVEWTEVVLYAGEPAGPAYSGLGPDIHLDAVDLDGDGVVEIVATHFFTGDLTAPPGTPPMQGKISLYGAPTVGGVTSWTNVNLSPFGTTLPLRADISTDQGFPFDVEYVDLNRDGQLDILATNHQPDNCLPFTSSPVPGRVYALEQPADGDLFNSAWTTHVLKDDIRPNPSIGAVNPPGRLAPGKAKPFWPIRLMKHYTKPWLVVGGDEASKVWVMKPVNQDEDSWEYKSAVVFDINEFYGPETTQMENENGVSISTIGAVATRYNRRGPWARAEIYIPVFEGRDIHVLSFARRGTGRRVQCTPDVTVACPAFPPPQ